MYVTSFELFPAKRKEKKRKKLLIVLRAFISMKAAFHRLENVFDENERATRPVIYDAVEGKVL